MVIGQACLLEFLPLPTTTTPLASRDGIGEPAGTPNTVKRDTEKCSCLLEGIPPKTETKHEAQRVEGEGTPRHGSKDQQAAQERWRGWSQVRQLLTPGPEHVTLCLSLCFSQEVGRTMVPPFLSGLLQELGEIMGGRLYFPKVTAIYFPPRMLIWNLAAPQSRRSRIPFP